MDARTGRLLSYEELFEGQPVHRTGLSEIRLDPADAADPARFRPPPGIDGPDQPSAGPTVAMPGLAGDVVRGARVTGATRIVRLRVAGPGCYRIDQVAGDQPAVPDSLGCDGDRQWQVTRSRLTASVGARPGPATAARVLPAWPIRPGCWALTACRRAGRPRWAGAGAWPRWAAGTGTGNRPAPNISGQAARPSRSRRSWTRNWLSCSG